MADIPTYTVRFEGTPLGPVARLLGITGVMIHPFDDQATVMLASGVSFVAPSHIAQWLATQ